MSDLKPREKARIAERIAAGEPTQRVTERLVDTPQKQTSKSEYESNLREQIAVEKAIRSE